MNQEGWWVEPKLWKLLPDKVKQMIIEVKKKGMKNSVSDNPSQGMDSVSDNPSPFTPKFDSAKNRSSSRLKHSDSILKNPQQTNPQSTTNSTSL